MMTRIFAFLLPAYACLAQSFTMNDQAFLAQQKPSSFTPLNLSPRFYWVASDLANGAVPTWTDRIVSALLTNATVAAQPVKGANGVQFASASSRCLRSNIGFYSGGNAQTFWLLMHPNGSGSYTSFLQFNTGNQSAFIWDGSTPHNVCYYSSIVYAGGRFTDNTTNDVTYAFSAGTTAQALTIYTNAISAGSWAGAVGGPQGGSLYQLGGNSGNGFYDGYIVEFAVWTNTTLSSTSISNLHYYATNTYMFTP